MNQLRSYLGEREEDESPLVKPGMRDDEIFGFENKISIKEYVDIYGAGGVGEAGLPSKLFLYLLREAKEIPGRKPGSYLTNEVQKPRLLFEAYGFGLVNRGELYDFDLFGEKREGFPQVLLS